VSDRRTLAHGLTLARVDVLRTVRRSVDGRVQAAAFLLFVGLATLLGGYGASRLAAAGGPTLLADAPVAPARGVLALAWLGLSVLVAVRFVGVRGDLDNRAGLLTTVPTPEAVLGVVVAEAALVATWVAPPTLGVAVGYLQGGGTPTLLATAPATAILTVVCGVAVGAPVGLALRHLFTRVAFLARHRTALAVLAFLAYLALIATGTFGRLTARLFEPLQAAPTGWTADVLLAGVVAGADGLRAAGAVAVAATLAVAGVLATTAVAERHWFADSVLAGETTTDGSTGSPARRPLERAEDAIAAVLGLAPAAVVVLAWRRAVRAPLKLLYVAYPLLGGVGLIIDVVRTGEVPAVLPAVALVFVAWAGAVVFTLNPLGDQGSALPATVLSRLDGREFVLAHVVAGAVVAVPLGTAVVAGLAVAAPLSPDAVLALVAATPVAVLAGSLVAVGVGTAFPRYEAVSVTRSTEAVVPSRVAFVVFTLVLLLAAGAGAVVVRPELASIVAVLPALLPPVDGPVDTEAVGLLARAWLVVVAGLVVASTQFAVRRFETVTVD
jgi:hypothetical protein